MPVEAPHEPDVTPGATSGRARRAWSGAALAAAVLGMAFLIMVAVATPAQLTRVDGSLAAARAVLHGTRDRLHSTRSQVAGTDGQADSVQHTLATDTYLLDLDQAQLAKSQGLTFVQGISVSELHICLVGVERALNQFALGDQSGASTTLAGMGDACQSAKPVGV